MNSLRNSIQTAVNKKQLPVFDGDVRNLAVRFGVPIPISVRNLIRTLVNLPIFTSSMHWHADITLPDPTPVGGSSDLVINQDGSYVFSGHIHDSGLPSYDVAVGWALQDADQRVYTFAAKGHVEGTDAGFSPNRDWNWNDRGSNSVISSNWQRLADAAGRWKADANIDLGQLLQDLEKLYEAVSTVIAIV
jgi:hypothetical protein